MATTPDVREATMEDLPGVAAALALAFHDDPVMTWVFGGETKTVRCAERFFTFEGRRHLEHPYVFTTEGYAGGAFWDPPGHWKTRPLQMLGMAPFMLRAVNTRVVHALRGFSRIEAVHEQQPKDHYYLAVLGTRPDRQGNGVGGALMAPVLDRCDRDGVGAYLESSKEENIPFYRRHGFEVVDEVQFPKGPRVWPMWRDPQPPVR
jgi:GNAT superfamily N-acetyltransferase